jgi:dTDP-4-dehydrorhamnose 3,5-epimerase
MSRFTVIETPLNGVWRIGRNVLSDSRGFLSRLFCAEELQKFGWAGPIAQVNHARTEAIGTVRGMHYQHPPHCDAKLVSCIRGAVWDVVVDLRKDSPTFLQWTAQILSADNLCALLIPPGCAHGFQSLEDGAELIYCHSRPYVALADSGLNPQDPKLAIAWPRPIALLSEKDRSRPMLQDNFQGLSP